MKYSYGGIEALRESPFFTELRDARLRFLLRRDTRFDPSKLYDFIESGEKDNVHGARVIDIWVNRQRLWKDGWRLEMSPCEQCGFYACEHDVMEGAWKRWWCNACKKPPTHAPKHVSGKPVCETCGERLVGGGTGWEKR